MIRRYYEEELRYLAEAGKAFAEAHPEEARYLNIDSVADRDPYVERLFEGFAFLAGRIHERLDDELPEYTESLFNLLYPHYLRPIPALSMVQFTPKASDVQQTTVLPKATVVLSRAVGKEATVCRFETTQDVRLQPIRLVDTALDWAPDGTSRATFTFELTGPTAYADLKLSPLRLHIHADASVAAHLHLFCTRHARRVTFRGVEPGADARAVTLEGREAVQPGGLGEDEALLPQSPYTFSGFRLLQEYLSYRQKFWCLDLRGFERFKPAPSARRFQVEIHFDESYPEDQAFRTEHIRLFSTPVVNLFDHDAEPVRVNHEQASYPIIASARRRASIEVYEVKRVVGIEERTGKRHTYVPYFRFQTAESKERGFITRTRVGPTDRRETSISLMLDEGIALQPESLSLELRCTNGSLPREALQERMITQLGPEAPQIVKLENLTQPTLILYPPTDRRPDLFWQFIAHRSLNHLSVASREALVTLLRLYDWTVTEANRRRTDGIREVAWRSKETLRRGAIVRGSEVIVRIQDGYFGNEGELCLFGLILSRFFALYATLNSFIHLTLETVPSGKQYQWTPERGIRPLL